ncbi:hypothetical protein BH10ACT3_BH10ACT3_18130 [soil metagenome]
MAAVRPPTRTVLGMKVTLMLADSAQAVAGKLYILGGGWSVIGPEPSPSAIAIKIEIPWNEAIRQHQWSVRLHDADGTVVQIDTPEGRQAVEVTGQFEVGRPTGAIEGVPLDLPLAVGPGPLPLTSGRYEWQLTIDERHDEDWTASFTMRG